jgi:hypothetical protein
MVNNFCKWVYEHTKDWDPTLQRIAFAAVPLVGAVMGAFLSPSLSSILGIGLALLSAWKGPEFVAEHAAVAIKHDEWAKTHPLKPFNDSSQGVKNSDQERRERTTTSQVPVPAPAMG